MGGEQRAAAVSSQQRGLGLELRLPNLASWSVCMDSVRLNGSGSSPLRSVSFSSGSSSESWIRGTWASSISMRGGYERLRTRVQSAVESSEQ